MATRAAFSKEHTRRYFITHIQKLLYSTQSIEELVYFSE